MKSCILVAVSATCQEFSRWRVGDDISLVSRAWRILGGDVKQGIDRADERDLFTRKPDFTRNHTYRFWLFEIASQKSRPFIAYKANSTLVLSICPLADHPCSGDS